MSLGLRYYLIAAVSRHLSRLGFLLWLAATLLFFGLPLFFARNCYFSDHGLMPGMARPMFSPPMPTAGIRSDQFCAQWTASDTLIVTNRGNYSSHGSDALPPLFFKETVEGRRARGGESAVLIAYCDNRASRALLHSLLDYYTSKQYMSISLHLIIVDRRVGGLFGQSMSRSAPWWAASEERARFDFEREFDVLFDGLGLVRGALGIDVADWSSRQPYVNWYGANGLQPNLDIVNVAVHVSRQRHRLPSVLPGPLHAWHKDVSIRVPDWFTAAAGVLPFNIPDTQPAWSSFVHYLLAVYHMSLGGNGRRPPHDLFRQRGVTGITLEAHPESVTRDVPFASSKGALPWSFGSTTTAGGSVAGNKYRAISRADDPLPGPHDYQNWYFYGEVAELILRSLNTINERLHQSFFLWFPLSSLTFVDNDKGQFVGFLGIASLVAEMFSLFATLSAAGGAGERTSRTSDLERETTKHSSTRRQLPAAGWICAAMCAAATFVAARVHYELLASQAGCSTEAAGVSSTTCVAEAPLFVTPGIQFCAIGGAVLLGVLLKLLPLFMNAHRDIGNHVLAAMCVLHLLLSAGILAVLTIGSPALANIVAIVVFPLAKVSCARISAALSASSNNSFFRVVGATVVNVALLIAVVGSIFVGSTMALQHAIDPRTNSEVGMSFSLAKGAFLAPESSVVTAYFGVVEPLVMCTAVILLLSR